MWNRNKLALNNKMIENPDKFQVILLDKGRSDNTNIEVEIGNEKIRLILSVKLLEVHIDDELNLNEHIDKICKSAGNQLNALTWLKLFLGLKEKKVLVNSHVKVCYTKLKVDTNELWGFGWKVMLKNNYIRKVR